MISDNSKSTIFQYYIKYIFIYFLVPVLSLGSFRLHIMCVVTIAMQKLTEGYVALR